jgi:DNA-binding NarL/FixJ family response regulator
MLLKSHAYLIAYDRMNEKQQAIIVRRTKMLEPLTEREQEVLQLILTGKSNKEIASALFVTESTIKTHARSIYSKYDVGSRAELISTLLKNETHI